MAAVDGLWSVFIYVDHLDRSLAFYRDFLGLRPLGPAGDGVVPLAGGSCLVALHPIHQASGDWPAPGFRFEPGGHALTFRVDDPDAWRARAEGAGVTVVAGPVDQVWGRVVFLRDPDARVVALARPAAE